MALEPIIFGISFYPEPSTGRPLFNGKVYIGQPDTDPRLPANQKTVEMQNEDGTTTPVSQPLTIGAGGTITVGGSSVTVLVDGTYSLLALDKNGSQAYYIANATAVESANSSPENYCLVYDTVASMVSGVQPSGNLYPLQVDNMAITSGEFSEGDGFAALYYIAPSGTTGIILDNGNVAVKQGNSLIIQNTITTDDIETIELKDGDAGPPVDSLPLSTPDIVISARTQYNSSPSMALLQLNAGGKIDPEYLPTAQSNLKGVWNPTTDGPNPPDVIDYDIGDYFYFSAEGSVNLFTGIDQTPHAITVNGGDAMQLLKGLEPDFIDGWYFINRSVITSLPADSVTFDNSGTTIASDDVQGALEEIASPVTGYVKTDGSVKMSGPLVQDVAGNIQVFPQLLNDAAGVGYGISSGGNLQIGQLSNAGVYEKDYITGTRNGALTIKYNSATKLETTSAGAFITGKASQSGTPVDPTDLVTVQYFQDNAGTGAFLPIEGGTLTGNLTIDIGSTSSSFLGLRNDTGGARISSDGSGNLLLQQTNASGTVQDTWIKADLNGAVSSYYNNSAKLKTTNTGITITGIGKQTSDGSAADDLMRVGQGGVVSSGSNSNGYYRIYGDGYKEQWGSVPVAITGSRSFPVAFTTAPTCVFFGILHTGTTNRYTPASTAVSTSSFSYRIASEAQIGAIGWHVEGY